MLLFLNISCSIALFPGYKAANHNIHTVPESWFNADTSHYLFNTKIDILKNHFSGLMVVKPMGSDTFRVVMITETGLKILDLELFPDNAPKVHYVMDAMNRKALIKTLSGDIRLALMNHAHHERPRFLTDKKTGNAVYNYKFQGRRFYYFMKKNELLPYQAKQSRGISNQVDASFFGKNETGPDSIIISHQNIALKVHLFRIIEETSHVDE